MSRLVSLTDRSKNGTLAQFIFYLPFRIWKGAFAQARALWSGPISPRLPRPGERKRRQMCSWFTLHVELGAIFGWIQCTGTLLTARHD